MIKNYPGMSEQDKAARTKLLSDIVRCTLLTQSQWFMDHTRVDSTAPHA